MPVVSAADPLPHGPDIDAETLLPRRRASVTLRVTFRVLIAAWIGLMALLAIAYLPGLVGGPPADTSTSTTPGGLTIPDPLIPLK